MSDRETIQENQYHFPYHHLTHEKNGSFYLFQHLFWGLEHYTYIKYVIDNINSIQPSSVLDVGCGEGRIISEITQKNPECVCTGIDISNRAIRFAQAFNDAGAFLVHDILSEATSEKFDLIVSCEVIEHIEPQHVPTFISNITASLKPGGSLIITTPTTNIPVNKKHYQHFTQEMFQKILSNDFSIKKIEYLNKVNTFSKLLGRLIANRWYISNSHLLNKVVFNLYKKKYLIGTEKTGSRIFIHAIKN